VFRESSNGPVAEFARIPIAGSVCRNSGEFRYRWCSMRDRGRSVWRSLRGMIAAWWRVDRVRVSPREGELLRLRPKSLVTVDGVPAEVLRRKEMCGTLTQGVLYECQTADGMALLDIRISKAAGRLEISWSLSGRGEVLLEHQIEVFG